MHDTRLSLQEAISRQGRPFSPTDCQFALDMVGESTVTRLGSDTMKQLLQDFMPPSFSF